MKNKFPDKIYFYDSKKVADIVTDVHGNPDEGNVEYTRTDNINVICTEIYNHGYNRGHNDTVESAYTNVYPEDIKTYHSEIIQELLKDMD